MSSSHAEPAYPDELTERYYRDNAARYAQSTRAIPMASCYARFERHVAQGGRILDVGVGSGRDMRYFLQRGYAVEGIDACGEMAAQAAAWAARPVAVMSVTDLVADTPYDAIWANAVLLHMPVPELLTAFRRLACALRTGGALFVSFRSGPGQFRHTDGRLYHGIDRASLQSLVAGTGLWMIDHWSEDDRQADGASQAWLYAIFKRM